MPKIDNKNFKARKYLLLLTCVIAVIFIVGVVYAVYLLNTPDTGYRVNSGATMTIDLTSTCGDCKKIARTAPGDIFVSTKTCAEWNAFKANATGVSLANCSGDGQPCPGVPTVTDVDGNIYDTVQIGTQCWMKENLNTGVMVPSNQDQKNNGTIEKYCHNDDLANCATYGGLYQWHEAINYFNPENQAENTQGICPSGWHLPSDLQWYTLEDYLTDPGQTCDGNRSQSYFSGGQIGNNWDCNPAGSKLSAFTLNGNNSSNFTSLLAGIGSTVCGAGGCQGTDAFYWTSTSNGTTAYSRNLNVNYSTVNRTTDTKNWGFSIRCVKN